MNDIENKIRSVARNLLEDKKVDLVIGYEKASLPLRTKPIFINNPNNTDKLVWNSYCNSNIAKYLPSLNKDLKIAVISKGCVGRTIVHLAVEKQVIRDNIIIIAVPCEGNIDRKKIEVYLDFKEIIDAQELNDEISIECNDNKTSLRKVEFLNNLCKTCNYKVSPVHDILIGEMPTYNISNDNFDDVLKFESKTPDEKWNELTNLLKNCIRCYSCREACPMCYCEMCFIDQSQPIWFNKTIDISDIMIFHIIRAIHLAGRCVGCGDCSNACPMGIDLSLINRNLEKIVKTRFDFTAGIDLDTKIPLSTFNYNDKEDFIIEE
ncbi:MAG: 4Fe-4S ferredoxin [Candidatus Helarchaeota archaeon]